MIPRLLPAASAVLAGAAVAAGPACAAALETGAGPGAALVAVDPQGGAAVLYPLKTSIRVQRDAAGPETAPVPRGSTVEGFAAAPAGALAVLHRRAQRCSGPTLLARQPDGTWTGELAPGPAVSSAALTVDPEGRLGAVTAGCGGDLAFLVRSGPGAWTREDIGIRVRPGAPVAVAVGLGGVAVAGAAGNPAVVAVRGAAGIWRRLTLPGGALAGDEYVTSLAVGIDPSGRPVVLLARGPRRPIDAAAGVLGGAERIARRLEGSSQWVPFDGGPPPVALASAGQAIALVSAGGSVRVQGPGGESLADVGRAMPAVGPDGTLAWVTGPRRPGLRVVRAPAVQAPVARLAS